MANKKTNTEEAVEELEDQEFMNKRESKNNSKSNSKSSKKLNFIITREDLIDALTIMDSTSKLSEARVQVIKINKDRMFILAHGTRIAEASILLDGIYPEVYFSLDLKTFLDLMRKFSSKSIEFELNLTSSILKIKDKNFVVNLNCNHSSKEDFERSILNSSNVMLKLDSKDVEVLKGIELNAKIKKGVTCFSSIFLNKNKEKDEGIAYFITNSAILNIVIPKKKFDEEDYIKINLENDELSKILKAANIRSAELAILQPEEYGWKAFSVQDNKIKVVFNFSEVDVSVDLLKLYLEVLSKGEELIGFKYFPFKFLDVIKKATPLTEESSDVEFNINSEKEVVNILILGKAGHKIKSNHKPELLKTEIQEYSILFTQNNLTSMLEHFGTKVANFSIIDGKKMVLKSEQDEKYEYISIIMGLNEPSPQKEYIPI